MIRAQDRGADQDAEQERCDLDRVERQAKDLPTNRLRPAFGRGREPCPAPGQQAPHPEHGEPAHGEREQDREHQTPRPDRPLLTERTPQRFGHRRRQARIGGHDRIEPAGIEVGGGLRRPGGDRRIACRHLGQQPLAQGGAQRGIIGDREHRVELLRCQTLGERLDQRLDPRGRRRLLRVKPRCGQAGEQPDQEDEHAPERGPASTAQAAARRHLARNGIAP